MMKKVAILCAILCMTVMSHAQEISVNITAGTLSTAISQDFTSITIRGTMDVRDFAYLHDNAMHITSIDLSDCKIAGYDSRNEQYLGYHSHFEANAIPPSAFFGFTSLQEVVLPATVTAIGEGAFAGCVKLISVDAGESLQRIHSYAFSGCTALPSIPQSQALNYIGDYAFDKCAALTAVDLSGCTEISYLGARAFGLNTALKTVKLPTRVEKIGNAAFAGCSVLNTVVMPKTVNSLGEGVFAACPLLSSVDLSGCAVEGVPAWTFSGCSSIKKVVFNEGMSQVGEGAFYYCTSLPGLILPAGMKEIDGFAFAGCTALAEITFIPENLEEIARYAFYKNTQVERVYIPSHVSYIGDHAFDGCVNADTFITTREVPAELGEDVFVNMMVEHKTLMVYPSVADIYRSTAQWQDFGTINGDLTSVEEVENTTELNAHFEQYELVVSASQEIAEVRLFDMNGKLLSLIEPHTMEARIDTRNFVDNIYLLFVTTADGRQQVSKMARIIR